MMYACTGLRHTTNEFELIKGYLLFRTFYNSLEIINLLNMCDEVEVLTRVESNLQAITYIHNT